MHEKRKLIVAPNKVNHVNVGVVIDQWRSQRYLGNRLMSLDDYSKIKREKKIGYGTTRN